MTADLVRDLFKLPAQVGKGDFVIRLADGVAKPVETLATYVATPALVNGAFKDSLNLIKGAIDNQTSQGAFLHGSFGSGKSHFMAVLSLLLDNHKEAWAVSDFHPLRADFDFVGKKKILQLRFHMIGQRSLESAIFSEYLRVVREDYPEAPLPALFGDDKLFDDAAGLLAKLGADKFFSPMNAAAPAKAKWGALAQSWDQKRFDQARTSKDLKERGALYSALAKSHFRYAAEQKEGFVDLDLGLKRITEHAHTLGFDALVLLLDELVLWLASRASEAEWLHNEAQKMAKLIEAQHGERPIPIISFIARQRDLADMVGEVYAGFQEANLRASLTWSKGRFQTIALPDTELPEIVSRRIVVPKDSAAKAKLDDAFQKIEQSAGKNWNTLLGEADAAAFRKVYPFSPVLVETLVALSNTLQRERTALRLLMELLIEHIPELKVGDLVGVGDLFDVLAGGDDTTDGPMRTLFESAKDLYRNQLLPIIWAGRGTGTAEKCQRLREGHKVSLGCSGCPEKLCRRDNRLAKTLILGSLVKAPAFRNLSINRLAALNHGTLGKMPVPGQENALVAQLVRDWASQVGQIHVGEQADPSVNVELTGVNLEPIINKGREHDKPPARRRVIRNLLFEALQLTKTQDEPVPHKVGWRGSERRGAIRFGNIRTMTPEQLLCPEGFDWYIIIDYPFDDPGFGPNHDIEVATAVRDSGTGTWALTWLPSFLSEANNRLVGELAVLEHILQDPATTLDYIQHLTVEQQNRARTDLENLRSQKRAKLRNLMEQAYGIALPVQVEFDSSRTVDEHVMLLKPGVKLDASIPPNLGSALEHYVRSLLDRRFPRHPNLQAKPTKQLIARMVDFFERLLDTPDKKLAFPDKDLRQEVQGLLEPLGLVRTTENAALLWEDQTLQSIENTRNQKAIDTPTVAQVRSWHDPKGHMGLASDVADVVVRAYARWSARTFSRGGLAYEVQVGVAIHGDVELEKPPLPAQAEWTKALDAAGHMFGVALPGKALHADNLKRFETQLKEKLKSTSSVAVLPDRIAAWIGKYGAEADAHRLTTAKSASTLCAQLEGKNGLAQAQVLAGFKADTSAQAVGKSIARAAETSEALANALFVGVFDQLEANQPKVDVLLQLADALRQDELNVELAPRVKALAEAGQKLLIKLPPPPPLPPQGSFVASREGHAKGHGQLATELKRLVGEVLSDVPGDVGSVTVRIEVTRRK